MTSPLETRPLDVGGLDPASVYARLRSHHPHRPSYLIESLDPTRARFSVVGYRVQRGSVLPPAADAYGRLARALEGDASAQVAEAFASATVGFVSTVQSVMAAKIALLDDEGSAGRLMVGSPVVVFDHATGEVTIAGAKEERDCDRLEWELANATGVAPAKTAGDAWPETVRREYERDQLAARLRRARPFLGDEVETLKLCQVLLVPIPEVEALDVYRALPRREGDAVGYYLDFVETQMAPAMAVFGTSGTFIWQGGLGQGGPDAPPLDETLHAQLPRPELTGEPSLKAVKLINKLEKFSRQMLGGVVGYSAAGGLGQWALIDRPVYVHGHNLVVPRVVGVGSDTTAESFDAEVDALASDVLRAAATCIAS